MRNKTVKTYIKQLVKKLGSRKLVADHLGLSSSYIYRLEKGKCVPSESLRKLIKVAMG